MKFIDNPCYRFFAEKLILKLETRNANVRALLESKNTKEIQNYITEKKDFLKRTLTFPVEPDVKSIIVSNQENSFFRIENVFLTLSQSYFIPLNLYIPLGSGPFPVVIVTTGHWPEGKSMAENQLLCKNLAANGIMAAAYDPIYQGERNPFPDDFIADYYADQTPDIRMVNLHMQGGALSYLMGHNLGELFVLDGISIIDYLVSRPDIDKARIGITGQSGGGTQASYLAAMDDRIMCYSPIQSTTRTALTIAESGIGDCEQSILGSNARQGFDCADVLWAAFPKPCLINASDGDFFNIHGVYEIADELSALYSHFELSDSFQLKVTHGEHWLDLAARQNEYDFFVQQFFHKPRAMKEISFEYTDAEKLNCIVVPSYRWPNQLLKLELETVKSLRLKDNKELQKALYALVEKSSSLVPDLPYSEEFADNKSDTLSVILANADTVEKYKDQTDSDMLYLQPFAYEEIFRKEKTGYDILTGIFNECMITGTGFAALLAGQIITCLRKRTKEKTYREIILIAEYPMSTAALLAGALMPEIRKTCLIQAPLSLENLFNEEFHIIHEALLEPGLLAVADLPEIAALNKEVITVRPENPFQEPA